MNNTRVEHRFAVIMCADVVGYSRLMGIDEEGTLAALQAARRDLVDLEIAKYQGRIVRTMGDGPRAVSRQLCRGVSSLYCGYTAVPQN